MNPHLTNCLLGDSIGLPVEGIPAKRIAGLHDWPIHPSSIQRLGTTDPPCYPVWPISLIRNFLFLIIVVIHGFRRLLPPY